MTATEFIQYLQDHLTQAERDLMPIKVQCEYNELEDLLGVGKVGRDYLTVITGWKVARQSD